MNDLNLGVFIGLGVWRSGIVTRLQGQNIFGEACHLLTSRSSDFEELLRFVPKQTTSRPSLWQQESSVTSHRIQETPPNIEGKFSMHDSVGQTAVRSTYI